VIEDPEEILLVVVGAGASYDSVAPAQSQRREIQGPFSSDPKFFWEDVRPPLTQGLVADGPVVRQLTTRYERVTPLVHHLRGELGPTTGTPTNKTLEEALRDYSDLDGTDIPHHLAAFRFFLRDYLWLSSEYALASTFTGGMTNYTDLVGRCYRWAARNRSHVRFVTFNYDTLLDRACASQWGLDPEDLSTYTADRYGKPSQAARIGPVGLGSPWGWNDHGRCGSGGRYPPR
jgi:hypothetical protein